MIIKKIFKIIILTLIIILTINTYSKANQNEEDVEETIKEQQETFGINSFIENSNEYAGEFFEDIDISEILNSAISGNIDNQSLYQRILNLFGTELQTGIKTLLSILVIIIIHSILKSVSENLENDTISTIIYYVQYIAIVTIIMSNFTDIVQMVKDTANNLTNSLYTANQINTDINNTIKSNITLLKENYNSMLVMKNTIEGLSANLAQNMNDFADKSVDFQKNMFNEFAKGASSALGTLKSAIETQTELVEELSDNLDRIGK